MRCDSDLFLRVRDADEKDDMAKEDSDKFASIITQVESLHELGTATNHHLPLLQVATHVYFPLSQM
jgi:hypothetical protein